MKKEPQQKLSKAGLENYKSPKTKVAKTIAVKFLVTEDEMQALEILCKDWDISIAQAVRTMIGFSSLFGEAHTFVKDSRVQEFLKKHGKEPSEIEWRLITLKRFAKYWDADIKNVHKL
jgi:hypothetical protein